MSAFLLEALILLFVAGFLGCVAGCFLHHAVNQIRIRRARPHLAMAPVVEEQPKEDRKVSLLIRAGRGLDNTPPSRLSAPRDRGKDDLTQINGLGTTGASHLNELGIFHFDQIADLTRANVRWLDEELDLKGRIDKEGWVPQARRLASEARRAPFTGSPVRKAKSDFLPPASVRRKPKADAPAAPATITMQVEPPPDTGQIMLDKLEAPRDGVADDLRRIKGVGPKIEKLLNELGVFHFDQIASWTRGQIAHVDDQLKFKGRIERENWIEQARQLLREAAADTK